MQRDAESAEVAQLCSRTCWEQKTVSTYCEDLISGVKDLKKIKQI